MIFTTHLWIPRMVEAPISLNRRWGPSEWKAPGNAGGYHCDLERIWCCLWLAQRSGKVERSWSFWFKSHQQSANLGFLLVRWGPFLSCWCRFNISQWSAELVNPKACTSWPGRPVKRPMRGAWRQHWARGALKLLMLLGGRVLNIVFRWLHPVNSIYIVDHERTWPDHES